MRRDLRGARAAAKVSVVSAPSSAAPTGPGDPGRDAGRRPRPLVLIPTYNERENLAAIVAATLAARRATDAADVRATDAADVRATDAADVAVDILVIDDASPDGTGALADGLAAEHPRVHVLHRAGKQGLGRAYLDGFRWGLAAARGYTHLISMDADFSHDPGYLPGLIGACHDGPGGADVVIGSRYVAGGGTRDWGLGRRLISRAGGLYARTLLGLPVCTPTLNRSAFDPELAKPAQQVVAVVLHDARGYAQVWRTVPLFPSQVEPFGRQARQFGGFVGRKQCSCSSHVSPH